MNTFLKLSEAGSIAIHALALIAGRGKEGKCSSSEIAETYGISRNHLAKVMQQLVRSGLVESDRGPAGGFVLTRSADKISLYEIYTAIEGGVSLKACLLKKKFCFGSNCVLGGMLKKINSELMSYLENTKLSDIALVNKRGKK